MDLETADIRMSLKVTRTLSVDSSLARYLISSVEMSGKISQFFTAVRFLMILSVLNPFLATGIITRQ